MSALLQGQAGLDIGDAIHNGTGQTWNPTVGTVQSKTKQNGSELVYAPCIPIRRYISRIVILLDAVLLSPVFLRLNQH